MSIAFWSHWGWPLATAVVGLVFTGLVLRQFCQRRRAHQAAWATGMFLYSMGAWMEWYSEFSQAWDPAVYRVYYVVAATLVSFLGLGTVYLIFRRRRWGHIYLGYIGLVTVVFLICAAMANLDTAKLVPGITVGGQAMPGSVRVFSYLNTVPGTVALLGGAVYSVVLFARKREYAYRMWANVFIAAGTLVIAGAGSMARTGQAVGLYPAEMLGAALLLVGFLKAGTLAKQGGRGLSAPT